MDTSLPEINIPNELWNHRLLKLHIGKKPFNYISKYHNFFFFSIHDNWHQQILMILQYVWLFIEVPHTEKHLNFML